METVNKENRMCRDQVSEQLGTQQKCKGSIHVDPVEEQPKYVDYESRTDLVLMGVHGTCLVAG